MRITPKIAIDFPYFRAIIKVRAAGFPVIRQAGFIPFPDIFSRCKQQFLFKLRFLCRVFPAASATKSPYKEFRHYYHRAGASFFVLKRIAERVEQATRGGEIYKENKC